MPPRFDSYVAPARPRCGLWRTFLALLLIPAIAIALQGGALGLGLFLYRGDREAALRMMESGATPGAVLMLLASFLPLAAAILLVTWAILRRDPATLWGRDWLPDFLRGALVMALVMGGFLWIGQPGAEMPAELNVSPALWAALLLPALALIAVQTLSEELFFRGVLMQQLAARLPRWPIVWFWLPPLLFSAAHYAPGIGAMSPLAMGYALAFGLIAADLTRRSGNLGTAWGVHLANNAFAILAVSSQDQLSGLALWHLPYPVEQLYDRPWLALLDLAPLCLAWAILARPTAR